MKEESKISVYGTGEYLGRHVMEGKRHYLLFSPERHQKFQELDVLTEILIGMEVVYKKDFFKLSQPDVRLESNDKPMTIPWRRISK